MASKLKKIPRSVCPISGMLDLVGDRWTLLVIRDLFLGLQRFEEFLASPEGIATNILSQRLHWLVEQDILIREPDPSDGRKQIYSLTPRGEKLRPVIRAMAVWGMEELEGTSSARAIGSPLMDED